MWIGAITALMAALIATQQNDIKRILAYSTLSQLGYMVMAVGLAAKDAAMFHLVTHAFFKALLFLGSGAVIYACHHEQNIWKMGGLKKLPITFVTFLIGTLALMGFPYLSGFFSKDSILIAAQGQDNWIFAIALFTAFLTAYYMTRLLVVVFFGKERTENAEHAHEVPALMSGPLILLAIPSVIAGYGFFINRFLTIPEHVHSNVPVIATVTALVGAAVGAIIYWGKSRDPINFPPFANKLYFDEAYAVLIRYTHDLLARFSAFVDRWVIDLAVRTIAGCTWATGFTLRFLQFGNLQGYAFLFGLGVVALFYYLILK
jgi:NADH-quinone oxidoreductase subunit L